MAGFALEWACYCGCYLIFVGKTTVPEVLAALTTGAIAAALRIAVLRLHGQRMSLIHVPRLVPARAFANLVRDCGRVGHALLRVVIGRQALLGRFETRLFHARGSHPRTLTRRGIVTAAISLAPNTYVVGAGREHDRLVLHRLVGSGETGAQDRDPEWPV